MRYSTIRRDSHLLERYARTRDAVAAIKEAFKELKSHGVLMCFVREDTVGGRGKLLDVIAPGRYIQGGDNLLLLGPPGVGKTHLAVALGMKAYFL